MNFFKKKKEKNKEQEKIEEKKEENKELINLEELEKKSLNSDSFTLFSDKSIDAPKVDKSLSIEGKDFDFNISDIFGNQEESNGRMVLRDLLNEKKLKMITRISAIEMNKIARAFYFVDYFKKKDMPDISEMLDKYYKEMLILRISHLGKSRQEHIDGLRGELKQFVDELRNTSDKLK